MSLFDEAAEATLATAGPLAARLRPRSLDEVVGQDHLLGEGSPLRRLVEGGGSTSVVLWGPPGTGKTTLAQIISRATGRRYRELSAVAAGVKDVRAVIEAARDTLGLSGARTVLFIDEVHRFTRAQQDALLPAVEKGWVTLVAATTENPFFSVVAPLLSRSLLLTLAPLTDRDVATLVHRAVSDPRGYGGRVAPSPEAVEHLVRVAGGDARRALTALEAGAEAALAAAAAYRRPASGGAPPAAASGGGPDSRVDQASRPGPGDGGGGGHGSGGDGDGGGGGGMPGSVALDLVTLETAVDRAALRYDRAGDQHYDVVSAFIKSMRGGDVDAALHYLARMLEAGEDPRFVARRIVILASEDVGMADPGALSVAVAAAQALELVGLPEARLALAQAVVHLTLAPKSNAVTLAINAATADVTSGSAGAVPAHLRDSHYPGAARVGHGQGYRYPHDYPGSVVTQQYAPDGLVGVDYYQPGDNGFERRAAQRVAQLREVLRDSCDRVESGSATTRPPGEERGTPRPADRGPISEDDTGLAE